MNKYFLLFLILLPLFSVEGMTMEEEKQPYSSQPLPEADRTLEEPEEPKDPFQSYLETGSWGEHQFQWPRCSTPIEAPKKTRRPAQPFVLLPEEGDENPVLLNFEPPKRKPSNLVCTKGTTFCVSLEEAPAFFNGTAPVSGGKLFPTRGETFYIMGTSDR
jgi:hypothetical protein